MGYMDLSYADSHGTTWDLEGSDGRGLWAQTATGVRGHDWSYQVGAGSLTGLSTKAVERTLPIRAVGRTGRESMDRLLLAAARDTDDQTPGTMTLNGWRQRCLITRSSVQSVLPRIVDVELTVVLLDGEWRKPSTIILQGSAATGGVDYPHDYPLDLAAPTASRPVTIPSMGLAPLVGIAFGGPCTSPYVRIGEHTYQVDATVAAGGLIAVDPIKRTVTVTQPDGTVSDAFDKAVRGDGLGSDDYVFGPAPSGTVMASLSGCAYAQLTVWQRRLAPPLDEQADLTEARRLLDQARGVDLAQYTADSAQSLRDAMARAERLGEDATQQQADTDAQALRRALDGLVQVAPSKPTVAYVEPPSDVSVSYGGTVSLPSTCRVHWSDGSTSWERVSWDGVPSSTDSGTHTVHGTCAGQSVTCTVKVGAKPVIKPTVTDVTVDGSTSISVD